MHVIQHKKYGFIVTAICLLSFRAYAQEYAEVQKKLENIQQNFQKIAHFNENIVKNDQKIMLENAQFLMSLEDFERAALLLHQILTQFSDIDLNTKNEVLLLYGQCLSHMHYPSVAKKAFLECIQSHQIKYVSLCSRAILDLPQGYNLIEPNNIGINVNMVDSVEFLYALSKYYLIQKDYKTALNTLHRINIEQEHALYRKILYLKGVSLVGLRKYSDAKGMFLEILKAEPRYEHDKIIQKYAKIALARISYELKEFSVARSMFVSFEKGDEFFDESLYELVYDLLKEASFDKSEKRQKDLYSQALMTIEAMLLSTVDEEKMVEGRLLAAHIYEKLNRYDAALESYQQVYDEYMSVHQNFEKIEERYSHDLLFYMNEFDDNSFLKQNVFSQLMMSWFHQDDNAERVFSDLKTIGMLEEYLLETNLMNSKFLKYANTNEKTLLFPMIYMHVKTMEDMQEELNTMHEHLLEQKKHKMNGFLTKAQKNELKRILSQRKKLQIEFERVKHNEETFESEYTHVSNGVFSLKEKNVEIVSMLKAQYEEVQSIKNIIREKKYVHILNESELNEVNKKIELFESNLKNLEKEIFIVSGEIDSEDTDIQILSDKNLYKRGIENRLHKTLEDEDAFWLSINEKNSDVRQINDLLSNIQESTQNINVYLNQFQFRVEKNIADYLEYLKNNQNDIKSMQDVLVSLKKSYENVGQEVVATFSDNVKKKYHRFLKNASLGLADLNWMLKENKTKDLSFVMQEQQESLNLIQKRFSDALGHE